MDEFIGKPCVIHAAPHGCSTSEGVRVWCPELSDWFGFPWFFPWFCLERVKAEPVAVVLNPAYTATVISKTEVRVGDQAFPVENIRKLLAAVDSL